MFRLLSLMSLMGGCRSSTTSDEGTVVGNPGDSAMRIAQGSDGEIERASVSVDHFSWIGCDGEGTDVEVDEEFDLMGTHHIEIPAGKWCEAWAVLSGPLEMVAVPTESDLGEDEPFIVLSLEVEAVALYGEDGWVIDGDTTVLELGHPGWFSVDALWDGSSPDVFVDPEHPDHEHLTGEIFDGSALFEDPDSDGEVSDEERENGPIALGADHPQHEEEQDEPEEANNRKDVGGCGGDNSVGWLFLPVGLMSRRRWR
jgi:hypothetical protein